MSFKLIIKNFISQEKDVYFMEVDTIPEEVSLLEDLEYLGIVKDLEVFKDTNWYQSLSAGSILLNKKCLYGTIQIKEVSEIPKDLLDENSLYIYKVISSTPLESYLIHTTDYFTSSNRDLKFHSDIDTVKIVSAARIKVVSKLSSEDFLGLLSTLTESVPELTESYEINSYKIEIEEDSILCEEEFESEEE